MALHPLPANPLTKTLIYQPFTIVSKVQKVFISMV